MSTQWSARTLSEMSLDELSERADAARELIAKLREMVSTLPPPENADEPAVPRPRLAFIVETEGTATSVDLGEAVHASRQALSEELRESVRTIGEAIQRGRETLDKLLPGLFSLTPLEDAHPLLPDDPEKRAILRVVIDESREYLVAAKRMYDWVLRQTRVGFVQLQIDDWRSRIKN